MSNKIKYVLGVCVVGICVLGSSAGFAISACPDPSASGPLNGCSLPGLVPGSFPYFTQGVSITLNNKNNGGFYLKASNGGGAPNVSEFRVSNSIDGIYNIDHTFFQFKAKSKHGDDVTGSIRIMGKLEGMPHQQTLMTADLTGVWNSTGGLIGFNTMNIQCGDAIEAIAHVYFRGSDLSVPA